MQAKSQKAPSSPRISCKLKEIFDNKNQSYKIRIIYFQHFTWKSTKVFTDKKAQKYEKEVAMELPIPRYSKGKSSPIKSDDIGEIPVKCKQLVSVFHKKGKLERSCLEKMLL